ncbi:MAG: hypothetical protein QM662_05915, partial [Gordonia sp. (in: high G+C Gram-positive bacteria)]
SPDLRDDVDRCAAAAGYRPVHGDPATCRAEWLRARAVVADPAAITVLAAGTVPRRSGLLLVSDAEPPVPIWRAALDLGACDAVLLPADEAHLVRTLTEVRRPRRHPGASLALIGAHGGAGTSILAAAVATAGTDAGERVLLLDVDDLSGGLDLLLGVEDRPGLRWQDLTLSGGTVSGQALHHALPQVNERLSVLTGRRDDARPITGEAVLATIDAGRTEGDLVVVDLPRGDSDVVRGVIESVDLVVVVTTATVTGCAATRQVARRLLGPAAAVGLVVRGPSPGGLRAGQLAEASGLPLLASYRPDPRLPGRIEDGRPLVDGRRPLTRAAHAVYTCATTPAPAAGTAVA